MASPLDTLSSAHAPPGRAVGSSVLVAFVCATALLAGVGYIGAWNVQRVYDTNALVAHTYAVQGGVEQLLATLIDAETGQRGFIITGDVKYLEPYESANGLITQRLDELATLHSFYTILNGTCRRTSWCLSVRLGLVSEGDGPQTGGI